MKKVLLISQNFYPEIGSAANRMKNIYELLKNKGYFVQVLTTEPSYPNKKTYEEASFWDDEELNNDRHITRIPIRSRKYSGNFVSRLFYYLEMMWRMIFAILKDRQQYDVIFVSSPPIFVAFAGLLAKWKFKNKLILDIRDLWPESLKGVGVFHHPIIMYIFYVIERILYRKADFIIINSLGFQDYIKKQLGPVPAKIVYLPNAARQREMASQAAEKVCNQVIYAGNLGRAQDVSLLKELAVKLSENDISLTVIGYGVEKNQFYEFAQQNGLKNISFLSPTTRKKCLNLIGNSNVAIVTLKQKEVFQTVLPGRVIDYMTCKVPIVGSVSGFSRSLIEKEKVGLVSEDGSAADLFHKIIYLLKSKELRQEMSRNGEAYIRKSFIWEKNIETLVDCIEK
ncbi:MAG TPA: glycosyltransferase WbuB [Bacillus bacterium]|uniref:Glycosyltransferase WbuB n=1 Tax=Siminovitchia fordii TaxID=254759 RepID=A0ABQ4KAZ1_9BACI|nr:glycosyltransferase family 4 protein [Siminovitchia fordii]GIN22305.1 glycosyltransferase WbuB [Siminovitchia fordii]HBZ09956.1 glycosyltransferase WbuB [Bacillus sp. (in: firmicutes)]